jgi:hypothetical protein
MHAVVRAEKHFIITDNNISWVPVAHVKVALHQVHILGMSYITTESKGNKAQKNDFFHD